MPESALSSALVSRILGYFWWSLHVLFLEMIYPKIWFTIDLRAPMETSRNQRNWESSDFETPRKVTNGFNQHSGALFVGRIGILRLTFGQQTSGFNMQEQGLSYTTIEQEWYNIATGLHITDLVYQYTMMNEMCYFYLFLGEIRTYEWWSQLNATGWTG